MLKPALKEASGLPSVRRGARSMADVPREVKAALESGSQSVNHIEQMTIDMPRLARFMFPGAELDLAAMQAARFLDRMRAGAQVVWDLFGVAVFDHWTSWESDTARGWAAFAVGLDRAPLDVQISRSMMFAEDPHFAVREWAWLGLRPAVVTAPEVAISLLQDLTGAPSPYLRRFASEVTRPRGVWSQHIPLLKQDPERGRSLLDHMVTSSEKYVRDSIGNWVNDAHRSCPDWALITVEDWRKLHGSEVDYVCRRALRNASKTASDASRRLLPRPGG